ncbi:hypothetical protein TURU_114568 [Turdus rufiventris]|nr:hypothetical protein TURU_114568 [Turdus rufiventris]
MPHSSQFSFPSLLWCQDVQQRLSLKAFQTRLRDFTFDLKMFNSADTVFSLDNLFYEKPDMRQRCLENEERKTWFIAPAPAIAEIPPAEELQKELEKNSANTHMGGRKHEKFIQQCKSKTEEVEDKSSAPVHFGIASEKEVLQLSLGEREKISFEHEPLKVVSSFLSFDENKSKRVIGFSQQLQNKALSENSDDESAYSTLRKSLFKKSDNMHKNTEFKAGPVDVKEIGTYLNTNENMKEMTKEGFLRNNHHAPITKDSDFTLHRVNNEEIVSENGIKIPSFSNASEILDMTVAPIKALCSQRFDDWKEKFGPIGLTCKELTGDTLMDDLFEIHHADIIITTPEKWDSMTRRWRDNSIVQLVRLFLIDEIAEWLSDSKMPAVCLKIDEDQRPVKLRKIVLGFPCSDNQTEFKFDLTLNYKIAGIIQMYSEQKPALVFCATRKGVQQAASVLAKDAKFLLSIEQKQRLQGFANSLKDSKLRDLLTYGVAYHHAGMEISDRKTIEGAFTVGDLPVLCFSSGLDKVGIEAKLQETGRLMAWYYIAFDTVKQFFTMKGTETLNELITMISNCAEFVDVKLRINEKKILNTLNKDKDKITISIKLVYMFSTGVSLSNAMVNAGLTSFKKIEDINARELELILNRHPPFGNQIKESVLHLPKYELEIEQLPKYSDTLAEILVTVKLTNYEQLQTKRTAPDFHYVTLVIGDDDNQVIFNQKIMDSVLLKTGNWMKKIEVKRALKSEDISINLISSDYVGLDIQRAYTAFYLGPKPEGRKVLTNKKLKAESTLDRCSGSHQSLPAAKVDTGGRSKQEFDYKKYGNRECNHRCKNKDVCGHDCYKSRYCFSDASNVDFDLGDDIWDDIDDEKLVFASNFVSRELEHGNTCLQIPDECQPFCQYTTSKAICNISKEYLLDDESNDVKPFLGIFDGIL